MLSEKLDSLRNALAVVRLKEGYDLALLMLTDIMNETTHLLYEGKPVWLIRRAFGQDDNDLVVVLPGTLSRKKQVVPPLVEAARLGE